MDLILSRMGRIVFRMDTNRSTEQHHFGEQVEALIAAKGLSIRGVAEATGIPLTTLHRKLRFEAMAFTVGELLRIADVLGTTAGAIVTDFEAAA